MIKFSVWPVWMYKYIKDDQRCPRVKLTVVKDKLKFQPITYNSFYLERNQIVYAAQLVVIIETLAMFIWNPTNSEIIDSELSVYIHL